MKPRNNGVKHKSLEERAAEFGGLLSVGSVGMNMITKHPLK